MNADRKRWVRIKPTYVVGSLVLVVYGLFVLIPFLWTATIAFKPPEDFVSTPPRILPSAPTFVHFKSLNGLNAWTGLRNSLIVSLASSTISVVFGSVAGYAIARYKTGGRNFSFWLISQRLMPPLAILVPIFLLVNTVGLVDNLIGLTLIYSVFTITFTAWVVRSFYIMIPDDYEQAARIDGANRVQVLWHIMLPLGVPAILAGGAFAFVVSFTEFLFASILTRTKSTTLPVVISHMLGVQATFLGPLAAMVLISAVPAVLIGLLFYRHAVTGLSMGGVKG
ncbi:MAG: carbohydrate ABC transporter permease [Acidimicrobiia bacterium]|nr:carbohydrate ABC transporter permease [Acidimicrobiia bacterium]